jgi:hypothetical protein
MERITYADILQKVENIKTLTGENELQADFNSVYGGWRLIKVNPETRSHSGVFGLPDCAARMRTGVFFQFLRGVETGLIAGWKLRSGYKE